MRLKLILYEKKLHLGILKYASVHRKADWEQIEGTKID